MACSRCSCSAGSTRVLGVAGLRPHRILIARLLPARGPLPGGKTNTFFPSTHHTIQRVQALGGLLRSGSLRLGLTFVVRVIVVLRAERGRAARLKPYTHPPTHKHATHTLSYWLVVIRRLIRNTIIRACGTDSNRKNHPPTHKHATHTLLVVTKRLIILLYVSAGAIKRLIILLYVSAASFYYLCQQVPR